MIFDAVTESTSTDNRMFLKQLLKSCRRAELAEITLNNSFLLTATQSTLP